MIDWRQKTNKWDSTESSISSDPKNLILMPLKLKLWRKLLGFFALYSQYLSPQQPIATMYKYNNQPQAVHVPFMPAPTNTEVCMCLMRFHEAWISRQNIPGAISCLSLLMHQDLVIEKFALNLEVSHPHYLITWRSNTNSDGLLWSECSPSCLLERRLLWNLVSNQVLIWTVE